MNVKTGILFLIFCVGLGAVIVGQRLQIRSVGFESAQLDRELEDLREQQRILKIKLAKQQNPSRMLMKAREAGLNLQAPEGVLPEIPGKPKEEKEEESDA